MEGKHYTNSHDALHSNISTCLPLECVQNAFFFLWPAKSVVNTTARQPYLVLHYRQWTSVNKTYLIKNLILKGCLPRICFCYTSSLYSIPIYTLYIQYLTYTRLTVSIGIYFRRSPVSEICDIVILYVL